MAKDILVLNLGADGQFRRAVKHVTGLAQTYAETTSSADVYVATTRSVARAGAMLEENIGLLHVMGHGESSGRMTTGQSWWRPKTVFDVEQLAAWVDRTGSRLNIDGILLDGCDTFSDDWSSKIAATLTPGRKAVLIGTSRSVGWDEASTYVGAFYPALLRRKFPQQPARRRANIVDAHERATAAYETVLDKPSPFRCEVIVGVALPLE